MKKNKPSVQFWSALAAANLLALSYPIKLLISAQSIDENLFVGLAFMGFLFLLVVADSVSIVIAYAIGSKS